MNKYDALYIFVGIAKDDALNASLEKALAEVTRLGGNILTKESLGKRTFARPMSKKDSGVYVKVRMELDPSKVDELVNRYALVEEERPGEYFPVEESGKGTYLYNSRDLCMISHLPELTRAGAASLKVEGRMKNELYVATVARAYRTALDALAESEEAYREVLPRCEAEVLRVTTRDYCTGFYFGKPGPEAQNFESSAYRQDYRFLGVVEKDEKGCFIRQKNKFSVGDPVQAIRPDGSDIDFTVEAFVTEDGGIRTSCPHPGEKLYLKTEAELKEFDVIREEKR